MILEAVPVTFWGTVKLADYHELDVTPQRRSPAHPSNSSTSSTQSPPADLLTFTARINESLLVMFSAYAMVTRLARSPNFSSTSNP